MTAHDIVDGTIITNPSVMYLKYWNISYYYHLLLRLLVISVSTIILINMYSSILLGIILHDKTTVSVLIIDITSTAGITLMMTSLHSVEPAIFSSKYILNKY